MFSYLLSILYYYSTMACTDIKITIHDFVPGPELADARRGRALAPCFVSRLGAWARLRPHALQAEAGLTAGSCELCRSPSASPTSPPHNRTRARTPLGSSSYRALAHLSRPESPGLIEARLRPPAARLWPRAVDRAQKHVEVERETRQENKRLLAVDRAHLRASGGAWSARGPGAPRGPGPAAQRGAAGAWTK